MWLVFLLEKGRLAVDIESLYRTYGPMVVRRCRRLLRDESRSVDAMHDVFVEILKRKDTLDLTAPTGLLLAMATNVSLNRLRTARRHPEDAADPILLGVVAATGDSDVEERSLAGRILDRMFGRLPASSQLIAVLHYVDRLTLEEVAAEVGMSVSGVRKRLRALKEVAPDQEEIA
jgi:RNA polymerase sigma-70 factor (ECF subfamily)